MDRRTLLKSAAGAGALATAGGLATPAISQRAAARALRLVPHADLANLDPVWRTTYIARNAGLLVWDMLYGLDNTLTPRRRGGAGRFLFTRRERRARPMPRPS
jgi:peptide/nickel transport system substrate-binding protein